MGICCPEPGRTHRSDVPLADIVHRVCKAKVSRFGTRLDARSRLLIGHMDTPAPDGNLYTTKAVDLAEQAALLRRRVTNTDRPTCRLASTPTFAQPNALRFPSTSRHKESLLGGSPSMLGNYR